MVEMIPLEEAKKAAADTFKELQEVVGHLIRSMVNQSKNHALTQDQRKQINNSFYRLAEVMEYPEEQLKKLREELEL